MLGAGLTAPSDANAKLVLNNIGETVENGNFDVDINGDSVTDFRVSDLTKLQKKGGPKSSNTGFIQGLTGLNSVSNSAGGSVFAVKLAEGDVVNADLFNNTNGQGANSALLYNEGFGP